MGIQVRIVEQTCDWDICIVKLNMYLSTGLLVARLKGEMNRVAKSFSPYHVVNANTVVGDKLDGETLVYRDGWSIRDGNHKIVLRSSSQCLPMVRFDKALTDHKAGKFCIIFLQYLLELIINLLFNNGLTSSVLLDVPLITTIPTTPPTVFGTPQPQSGKFGMYGGGAVFVGFGQHSTPSAFGTSTVGGATFSTGSPTKIIYPQSGTFGKSGGNAFGAFGQQPAPSAFGGFGQSSAPSAFGTPIAGRGPGFSSTIAKIIHTAPESLATGVPSNARSALPFCNMNDDCTICHKILKQRGCKALHVCNHVFHSDCI